MSGRKIWTVLRMMITLLVTALYFMLPVLSPFCRFQRKESFCSWLSLPKTCVSHEVGNVFLAWTVGGPLTLSSLETRNSRSYIPIPPYVFKKPRLIKHRKNLTLYLSRHLAETSFCMVSVGILTVCWTAVASTAPHSWVANVCTPAPIWQALPTDGLYWTRTVPYRRTTYLVSQFAAVPTEGQSLKKRDAQNL